jgi:hypothetical protein
MKVYDIWKRSGVKANNTLSNHFDLQTTIFKFKSIIKLAMFFKFYLLFLTWQ